MATFFSFVNPPIGEGILNDKNIDKVYSMDNGGSFNVSQAVIAGILEGLKTGGNIKKSVAMAGSVGVSTLIQPGYFMFVAPSTATEKFLVEPVAAGAIYSLANALMKSEKGSVLKNFLEGIIITEASAGINVAVVNYPSPSGYNNLRETGKSPYVMG